MDNPWEALVNAQLEARDRNRASGMSDHGADHLLVRNLQEYVRLNTVARHYLESAARLRGETP